MSNAHSFDAKRLDVAAFAAARGSIAGEWPLGALARLASMNTEGSTAAAPPVTWQARGERAKLDGAGIHPGLVVAVTATMMLECQRCLQPMSVPLQFDRRFFFVEGEDAAAALDSESEDDVLALVPQLDLRSLVEDELLLALPLVPRHEACPLPLPRPLNDPDDVVAAENPFAALTVLKRGSTSA